MESRWLTIAGSLARVGQPRRPEPIQFELLIEMAGQPTRAPLARAMQLHRIEPRLHAEARGVIRDASLGREQRELARPLALLVEGLHDPRPGPMLAVVDLAQIQALGAGPPGRRYSACFRQCSSSGALWRSSGLPISVRQIVSICCSPPDRKPARMSARSSSCGNIRYMSSIAQRLPALPAFTPSCRFCRTVSPGKCLGFRVRSPAPCALSDAASDPRSLGRGGIELAQPPRWPARGPQTVEDGRFGRPLTLHRPPSRGLGSARVQLPASTKRLMVRTADGESLAGVRIPSQREGRAEGAPTLLGFGGNAWNAEAMALTLQRLLPDRDVVVFHYRGYALSRCRPSARALSSDACDLRPPAAVAGRGAHRCRRVQHRLWGRRLSCPASTCCGANPGHALRLAGGLGSASVLVGSSQPASPPSYAHDRVRSWLARAHGRDYREARCRRADAAQRRDLWQTTRCG